jgi:hypothetical protein
MHNRFVILCILLGAFARLFSQNPGGQNSTADHIIEGGNLIIEILKVISSNESDKSRLTKSKEADCATKNFTNVCFVNRSPHILIVRLKQKLAVQEHEQEHELFINNNGKECCYRVKPGVYTYSIEQKTEGLAEEKLIRKGEILLEVCKDLEIKIK